MVESIPRAVRGKFLQFEFDDDLGNESGGLRPIDLILRLAGREAADYVQLKSHRAMLRLYDPDFRSGSYCLIGCPDYRAPEHVRTRTQAALTAIDAWSKRSARPSQER